MTYKHVNKRIPLTSLSISLADVTRIFERLSEYVAEEAERQTSELVKPPHQTEEEFLAQILAARQNAFRITVTICGADGSSIFGDSVELFKSSNLPHEISSIYMTNVVSYQGQTGRKPANSFALTLDFEKPPLVDSNNPVSSPTSNDSILVVDGDRDSWVSAVSGAVMSILVSKKNHRGLLHAGHVYDLGLMVFALPLALYVCWRLSGIVNNYLSAQSAFLAATTYVYIAFMVIWIYRVLFGYTKWAFPTTELKESENNSKNHQKFWCFLISGLLISGVWDFSKYVFIT